jgi:hypothetical protein
MLTRRLFAAASLFLTGFALGGYGQRGVAWPEADKLFHSDPRWLGSDAAFSIDLGRGRVLWMFNDTYVVPKAGESRSQSAFVRNTIAIQSGYDPSHAKIRFYWKTKRGEPSDIFARENPVWMWPGSGLRIGKGLLLFCERVRSDSSKDSLGFQSAGWNAYWVSNPDDEASAWKMKVIERSADTITLASQVLREGSWVYLFGQGDTQNNLYMARVEAAALEKGELGVFQWWSAAGWQRQASKRTPLLLDAGTETSIQRDPGGTGFVEVNSQGFGATELVMRRAQQLEGPWSAPKMIYRPPESDAPDAFVYAGKSHAELKGADLILTYATNGPDEKVARDLALYFPRFVKVDLHNGGQTGSR